ncbi:het domain-containing protein [Stagonosporopsis vannaccii]|nr:het domain-containing protein [Stagonosporopsis vannaccii]
MGTRSTVSTGGDDNREVVLWVHDGILGMRLDSSSLVEIFVKAEQGGSRLHPQTNTAGILSAISSFTARLPSISGNTGSDEAVLCARSWIDDCVANHQNCPGILPSVLPTRVLWLKGPEEVSLHISNGASAPYAALSHCWGKSSLLKLEELTLARFQSGIPWVDLPKTFKEAVSFTYRLGIKYLWIDSLCILQDSEQDWQSEGSMMSRIYQGATVTLAAVTSSDSTGGCFSTSNSEHMSRQLSLSTNEEEASGVFFRSALRHDQRSYPLDKRAWTFQERLLSPRVIRFEEQELLWECRQGSNCECSGITYDPKPFNGELQDSYNGLRHSESISEYQKCWQHLVEEYTSRSLSYPSDIFPALQGLAKVASPIMGDYLAGHWSGGLIHSLLWTTTKLYLDSGWPKSPVSAKWRAPTWSWASAPDGVYWDWYIVDSPLTCSLCSVEQAWTVPRGDDPTGQLTSGTLIIKGVTMSGKIRHVPSAAQLLLQESIDFGVDDPNLEHPLIKFRGSQVIWDYDTSSGGEHFLPIGAEIKALRLSQSRDGCYRYWLVLRLTEKEGRYKRVGLMRAVVAEKPHSAEHEMCNVYEEHGEEQIITII